MSSARPDHLTDAPARGRVSRRAMLVTGVAGIAAGVGGTLVAPRAVGALAAVGSTEKASGSTAASTDTLRRYVSSSATVPKFDVWTRSGSTTAPGRLFSAVIADVHTGVIFDDDGEPIWIDTSGADAYNLRVQTYQGEPVLTYTDGDLIDGYGRGVGRILDRTYTEIAAVRAGNGLTADLHEFHLTSAGTALVTAYPTIQADLTSVGGPKKGWLLDCTVQEVDVATGEVLLDWRAHQHIPVDETYRTLGSTGTAAATPFDAYHLNAADVDTKGDGSDRILVSARHTHTIYSIDRTTGDIAWRLGGRKSDFELTDDAVFAWQHHVTRLSPTSISVFDNHEDSGSSGSSRGLVLTVDEKAKTAEVGRSYRYDSRLGTAMGSVQTLSNGNVLVGWGLGHSATEFTAEGRAIYDVDFTNSYRTFRDEWTATPAQPPVVAARASDGDATMTLYATWNGATEVASWRFSTGASREALTTAATVDRSGFETSASVTRAAVVRATALDSAGQALASSAVVSV